MNSTDFGKCIKIFWKIKEVLKIHTEKLFRNSDEYLKYWKPIWLSYFFVLYILQKLYLC